MAWGDRGYGFGGQGRRQQAARRIVQQNTAARARRPAAVQQAERDYIRTAGADARAQGLPIRTFMTPGNYADWMGGAANFAAPGAPTGPRYGGGGGGGYGGGGGGGGGGMTQAMFDAMLSAIGAQGPKLDLPDFQGARLGAFNAAPYGQALGQINQAVTADTAASQAAGTTADQALRANYTNAYANAPVTQAPVAQQVGGALQATAGGGGDQAAVAQQSNQAAQSDQASFQNLLNVLAAADTQAQGSRLNQVALDTATAGRNINAQALGLRGGVNTQQAQAQNQWQQAAAERDYQNSLMRQQWNRDEAQGNWQQQNEMISNRLTPLMQLLQGAGTGVNTGALQQLLAQWTGKKPAAKKPAAKKPAVKN